MRAHYFLSCLTNRLTTGHLWSITVFLQDTDSVILEDVNTVLIILSQFWNIIKSGPIVSFHSSLITCSILFVDRYVDRFYTMLAFAVKISEAIISF